VALEKILSTAGEVPQLELSVDTRKVRGQSTFTGAETGV
jgi:hypothetical protein